jgi:hypothetical protein
MGALKVSARTATRDLKLLCRQDFIVRVEPTRSPRTHYFAVRAVGDTYEITGEFERIGDLEF